MAKTIVGALAIIFKKDKLLMGLRREPDHPKLDNLWEFPGGEVEFKEKPEQAVIREVEEEMGIKVKVNRLIPYVLMRYFGPHKQTKIYFYAYYCDLINGEPKPSNEEVKEVRWIKLTDIDPNKCTPFSKDLLQNVLKLV